MSYNITEDADYEDEDTVFLVAGRYTKQNLANLLAGFWENGVAVPFVNEDDLEGPEVTVFVKGTQDSTIDVQYGRDLEWS